MKKITSTIAALAMVGSLAAGCTTAEQTGTAGAIGGALIGAAVSSDPVKGAAIGAVAGGAGGYVLGKLADGRCRYRYPDGRVYIAACP
jgi:hypothetical protein